MSGISASGVPRGSVARSARLGGAGAVQSGQPAAPLRAPQSAGIRETGPLSWRGFLCLLFSVLVMSFTSVLVYRSVSEGAEKATVSPGPVRRCHCPRGPGAAAVAWPGREAPSPSDFFAPAAPILRLLEPSISCWDQLVSHSHPWLWPHRPAARRCLQPRLPSRSGARSISHGN